MLAILLAAGATWLLAPPCPARELTFEERVQAQDAIERVYYAHQSAATRSFEEAVPRAVLEDKVRKYLKQTVALEKYWSVPVTGEMLQKEMERQARQTRTPERLRELYAALGDDPFLARECLARPALVDRLTRGFFAADARFHADARAEAEALRRDLLRYGIDAFDRDPRRTNVEIAGQDVPADDELGRIELRPEEFARWRSRAPQQVGEIGPLHEERDAFVISTMLEERPRWARIASFSVRKRSWDSWWEQTAASLDPAAVEPAATNGLLPALGSMGPTEPSAAPSSCLPDDTWVSMAAEAPEARAHHTAIWTGSEMLVWGGSDDTYLNSGGRYDPLTDSWMPISTLGAPSPRAGHTAVWTGSLMIVWGGFDGSFLNTGGRYDPATDSWAPTSSVGAPSPRDSHSAVWTGSRMIVWGGTGGSVLNTGGRYDPATDSWVTTSSMGAPAARRGHTAVWSGSRMVVWGGVGGPLMNSGGRYDPATNTWTPMSTFLAPAPRAFHTAVWTGSVMVAWGGLTSGGYTNTGGRYDPVADSWSATSSTLPPSPRYAHTAVWTGSLMVVWGGTSGGIQDSGGRYDPLIDTWMSTSDPGPPRMDHTAVWTGSLMVVWGGNDGGTPLNTGRRYDPVANSWTPTSTARGPSARILHTAVWTGSLMVVWGGFATSVPPTYLDTGGRYDPATDSWTPTSTLDAPSARTNHTAVWTGDVMVVWGGYIANGSSPPITDLDTGGRYDPATDSWTPTSILDAPSARRTHTAVWTGSRMVVWGGATGNAPTTLLDTGGRYDPATDTWTPTSTAGAPSARGSHTAVWTGSLMVVWGGSGPSSLDTGGRYDPATDSWAPMSTTGAPSPRSTNTAVWTGNVMVVWGGSSGDFYLDTGGRYDPLTDSWAPTSTVGAPAKRAAPRAVWTGNVMVVWGGHSGGPVHLNSGGRYDPATDSWVPTSTVGAPAGRSYHSAVWTGSLMLVWGGQGPFDLDSGGGYALGQATDDDGDSLSECDGDCNDADAGAYAIPAEVAGLHFASDGVTLEWNSAAPAAGAATVHDVVVGLISELPVGSGAAEACLASGIAGSSTTDESIPPEEDGFWYLVRGRNSCHAGSYGTDSAGAPRPSGACP